MSLKILATLVALVPIAACSSAPTARRYDQILTGRDRRIEIEVQGSVARACDIPPARTFFAYNSDGIEQEGVEVLERVAECMKTGPLASRSILVTGYTDGSGDPAYNQELGQDRGDAVANQLFMLGVDPGRIFVRSLGERKASTEEPSAVDRKVELRLVEVDT